MTIIEDAKRLLPLIYKNPNIGSLEIAKISGWDRIRVQQAIRFLEGEDLLEKEPNNLTFYGDRITLRCSSKGIKVIEIPEFSEKQFSGKFDINLIKNIKIESLFKVDLGSIFKILLRLILLRLR